MSTSPDTNSNMWMTEHLRLTFFSDRFPLVSESEYSWWNAITGEQPEEKSYAKQGPVVRESGPVLGNWLTIAQQPFRADCALTIREMEEAVMPPELEATGFREVLSDFVRLFQPQVVNIPDLTRIAVGAILHHHVSDRAIGYELLSNYLPFVVDPNSSRDFFYQINRPRESRTVPSAHINRLSKYSVGKAVHSANRTRSDGETYTKVIQERFFARIELDISTSETSDVPMKPEVASELLGELVEHALEIAEKGDSKR